MDLFEMLDVDHWKIEYPDILSIYALDIIIYNHTSL